jgi:hypothetical protein
LKVEQNGTEICQVARDGGFICVKVPVQVTGGDAKEKSIVRYQIGAFIGRETAWPLHGASDNTLVFRIPHELFRERARLILEVFRIYSSGERDTLWSKRYEASWTNQVPSVHPLSD